MRSFRDVVVAHASDVHVDHEYTARLFDGDGAGGLRAVLTAAHKAKADLVLLAGDTFDCHRLPDHILEHTAATMREFGLPIVLLPGNHDPLIEEAVFHHPAFAKVDGLHILGLTHEEAVQFPELALEVWGRPHRDYGDMYDPSYRKHYFEAFVGVSHRSMHARFYLSPDYLQDGRTSYYAELNMRVLKVGKWSLNAHGGLSLIPEDLPQQKLRDFEDWSAQISRPVGKFSVSLGVSATNYPVFSESGRAKVVFAINRAF